MLTKGNIMFYKDLLVSIPKKKRIRKGSNYVYEILKRKGPKYKKDVVCCVGKAVDEKMMYPNEKYFLIHKEEQHNEPLGLPSTFNTSLNIGGFLLVRQILHLSRCDVILKTLFSPKDYLAIISFLTYNLLTQNSASQQYKYFASNNYTGINYILSETYLSKLFNQIIDQQSVNSFIEKWLRLKVDAFNKDTIINIDLDSTNYNVSGSNSDLAQRGKPKIDEGLEQINVAYFIERNSGLPIYFDIYFGSINDMSHFKIAVDKVKAIAPDNTFSLILDRGYYSSENLEFIEQNGYKYLCMGKSNKLFSSLVNKYPKNEITKAKTRIAPKLYGVKEKRKLFSNSDLHGYVYLFYNEGSEIDQKNFFQTEIEKAAKRILGKRDSNKAIINTYSKYIDIDLDDDDVIVKATIKYDYLDELSKENGYFYIVSNEDLSLYEVYKNYRSRDIVEKAFKMSKSESDFTKKYSQSDATFISKTLISFLIAIVRASIREMAHPYFVETSNETTQTLLLSANQIKAQKISSSYHMQYELTKEQKQILSYFELDKKDVINLIDEINQLPFD